MGAMSRGNREYRNEVGLQGQLVHLQCGIILFVEVVPDVQAAIHLDGVEHSRPTSMIWHQCNTGCTAYLGRIRVSAQPLCYVTAWWAQDSASCISLA